MKTCSTLLLVTLGGILNSTLASASNYFEPFMGEYKVVKVNRSLRNEKPYKCDTVRVRFGYETLKEKTDQIFVVRTWDAEGESLARTLANESSKMGDYESSSEVTATFGGARYSSRSKSMYERGSYELELQWAAGDKVVYREKGEWKHWRYGENNSQLELILEAIKK